jgi:hypothetical protein
MVKPDISRDYYHDLELKPGADINEVKKQFKRLGTCDAALGRSTISATATALLT